MELRRVSGCECVSTARAESLLSKRGNHEPYRLMNHMTQPATNTPPMNQAKQ